MIDKASKPLDSFDFFSTLEASEGPVLVAFVKPGCGACRMVKRALDEVVFPTFVVDGEDSPGLVADYEVFHFPALFLWFEGEYHARIECPPTPVHLARAVAEALRAPPQEEP